MTWRLILPTAPDVRLSSNARRRGNVWEQREATEQAYLVAKLSITDQWFDGPRLLIALEARILVGWPKGKRGRLPDVDSLSPCIKPFIDALQGRVILNDNQLGRVSYEQTRLDAAATAIYPHGVTVIDLDVYEPMRLEVA
jgi:hypothetical protein